ncbi:hypothetical protein G6F40_017535 [Rhizopus arrhizus]|nr:hypothetical protein G6F40_017535 [Rhizopus arrhizus]
MRLWPYRKASSTVGRAMIAITPITIAARHQHVDDGAADHRTDDADRQVAARVLGFLGGGGDRIEAVEGEEDDCDTQYITHYSG